MALEIGAILKVVQPVGSFVFGTVSEYVGYIGSYSANLDSLHKHLRDICNKKDDVERKVKVGEDRLEGITREASNWLLDVRNFVEDETLKELMYNDIETAKYVVKLMGKSDLKRRVRKESEMQEVAVKVMQKLKEEMETSEEDVMTKMREADYKKVAEVVVEVMKDTMEEFKKLMKEDKKMAVIATKTLKGRDLDKLTKGDKEMEEIVREAKNAIDEELWQIHEESDLESNALLHNIPMVDLDANKNRVKEAANKLFTPLANLLTPLQNLMNDADFKKAVPEAGGIKLGLEVIDGLFIKSRGMKKETDDNNKQHRHCCCCSSFSVCDYHGRYQISKAAKLMAEHLQEDFASTCPDTVTLPIRTVDLKQVPTQFLIGLDSRAKLLHQIVEKLNDDQVHAVGVWHGWDSNYSLCYETGKTVMAKEVSNAVKDIFNIKVMVEVSDSPDLMRIQAAIAESIDLPLHDVDNIAQRAIRIYNRLSSEKKTLIILDNIWKKLNLNEIGIPNTCTLLLTTREREVCRVMRVMGVSDVNILEVGLMNTNEARELFKSQAGNQADVGNFKRVVERLLSKCGGLPLAIVATANSLKDKDLSSWEKFASDLEKPVSSLVGPEYRHTYSILNSSYKFIETEEKKIFFLLACLSPLGSSASIETLMRYGIGLNLFQHVNKLCEAIEQANTWTSELLSSSMLLEGDAEGDVKIHDIVRSFAISFAAKEESHKFMVEDIPRWLDSESFNMYTGMSLMSGNDYSRLSGVKAYKLQILILKGGQSQHIDDPFFMGMVNLEVLVMSYMDFQLKLPESMSTLEKLRTLCMERCKLGDIKQVGNLTNLLVLSLRESFVKELPNEIGELSKLRLLDLNDCTFTKVPPIPASVLGRLAKLEGLFLLNTKGLGSVVEREIDDGDSGKSENEDITLPCLNAVEIQVLEIKQMPVDGRSLQNVDKFTVYIGHIEHVATFQDYCRALCMHDCEMVIEEFDKNGINVLLNKADMLSIISPKYCKNLVPQLNKEGFRDLKYLHIQVSSLTCIVKVSAMENLIAFPSLQSLELRDMLKLKVICEGEAPQEMFSKLKNLTFERLSKLMYGLPLVPHNLEAIDVSECSYLKFIFLKDEEPQIMKLPFLKTLELCRLDCLSSLVGPRKYFVTCEAFERDGNLFDGKITCPSLELLEVYWCNSLVRLWGNGVYDSGFQMLKVVKLLSCDDLLSIGPPSLFSGLVRLETLSIQCCKNIREVICCEETTESEIHEQLIRFPRLMCLELSGLDNFRTLCTGGYVLEFPELKELTLESLSRMNNFSHSENSESLFGKIDFPCLEVLEMTSLSDEVTRLWDWQVSSTEKGSSMSNPVPMLRRLRLGGGAAGIQDIPSVILEKLSSLTLHHFSDAEGYDKEWFVCSYSQLLNLEELNVKDCGSFNELFKNWEGADTKLFCERLKTLKLKRLPMMKFIPLHLFTALASLTLEKLNWEYVISGDMLANSLQQLEFLKISECDNMETVVVNVVSDISLHRLKQLILQSNNIKGFSSSRKEGATLSLPSLEVLEIHRCHNMEYFWSGLIVAPKLREVSLIWCSSLQQLLVVNPEHTLELPSLQLVSIMLCHNMTSIFSVPFKAPKLREVEVVDCKSLQGFCPGNPVHNGVIELPFLEDVEIKRSPNFHSFSAGPSVARNLNHVKYNKEEYSMVPYDYELNRFLQESVNLIQVECQSDTSGSEESQSDTSGNDELEEIDTD